MNVNICGCKHSGFVFSKHSRALCKTEGGVLFCTEELNEVQSAATVFAWSLAGRQHQTRPDHGPSVPPRTPLHSPRSTHTCTRRRTQTCTHQSLHLKTWTRARRAQKHVYMMGRQPKYLLLGVGTKLCRPNSTSRHEGWRRKRGEQIIKHKK